MGAIIEAVATAHSGLFTRGALRLADHAARECLERAGRHAREIDLLINAGIYREDNLAEPALASMIQQDIGANPGHPPAPESHGTFSFDVANGGSGALTALQLLDGMLRSHTIALGLAVTSDAHPSEAEGFPFADTGAAVLVSLGPGDRGFIDFAFETSDEIEELFSSHVSWHAKPHLLPFTRSGKNVLSVEQRPDFEREIGRRGAVAAKSFMKKHDLAPTDIDLLVPSEFPPSFGAVVGERLEVAADRVMTRSGHGAHTSGPLFALERAIATGRFERATNVLFVTAGAATVGLALYRPQGT